MIKTFLDAINTTGCGVIRRSIQGQYRKAWQSALAVGFALISGGQSVLAQTPADTLFVRSAIESTVGTVDLPVFRGSSGGQTVYYIITESSDQALATQLGVNFAPRLANARNSGAVQYVSTNAGPFTFPATVNFAPVRVVSPLNGSFPPTTLQPGAIGNPGYSPLIQLPNGIILNAPHVANSTGQADRVISLNTASLRVVMDEVDGFQGFQPVRYIVTDASTPEAAALENATYASALANLPGAATANLALIRDGQRGRNNVQRQGINSALTFFSSDPDVTEGDPLNILQFNPLQAEYSPMWESEIHQWVPNAVANGQNLRQRDYNQVEALEAAGLFFPPPPSPYVNCPIIARRSDAVAPTFTPVLASFTTIPSATRVLGGGTQFRLTATVTDGSGRTAEGVRVAVLGSLVQIPLSCVTASSGTCTISYFVEQGAQESVTVVALNRTPFAPGLPASVVLTAARGTIPFQ